MPTTIEFPVRAGMQIILTSPDVFTPPNLDTDLLLTNLGTVDFELNMNDLSVYPSSVSLGFRDRAFPSFLQIAQAHELNYSFVVGGDEKFNGIIDPNAIGADYKQWGVNLVANDGLTTLKMVDVGSGTPSGAMSAMFPELVSGTDIYVKEFVRRLFSFAYPDVTLADLSFIHDWETLFGSTHYTLDHTFISMSDLAAHYPTAFSHVSDFLSAFAASFGATFGAIRSGKPYFKKLWHSRERTFDLDDLDMIELQPNNALAAVKRVNLVDGFGTKHYIDASDNELILNMISGCLILREDDTDNPVSDFYDPIWGHELGSGSDPWNIFDNIGECFSDWRGSLRQIYDFTIRGTDYLPTDRFTGSMTDLDLIPSKLSIDYVLGQTSGTLQVIPQTVRS